MQQQDHGVRVLHAFSNMTVGRVVFPPGMVREKWLRAGLVEVVTQEYADEQIKAAPVDRMMRTRRQFQR